MQTFILPGFSEKNRDWIDTITNELGLFILAKGIYWQHWGRGHVEDGWIEEEAKKIIANFNNKKANIIAKSVGVMICLELIKSQPQLINEIILCGILLNDFLPGEKERFSILKNFPSSNILCIQNDKDSHGNYVEVEVFIHNINPNIKIISKPRDDHHYPYSEDFISFLKQ